VKAEARLQIGACREPRTSPDVAAADRDDDFPCSSYFIGGADGLEADGGRPGIVEYRTIL
jgi:hypothetical protein